jgi:hypothetical protein
MGIVDDLLASPGLYTGVSHAARVDTPAAARILITPLPGRAGVTLDYELYNPTQGMVLGHEERTIVGKAHDGGAFMVVGHTHGDSLAVLRETDPGVFELGDEAAPYPMKIVLTMPAPGKMRHAWWYGPAGGEAVEQEVAEVALA